MFKRKPVEESPPTEAERMNADAIVRAWDIMSPHCRYCYMPKNEPHLCTAESGLYVCAFANCPIVHDRKIKWTVKRAEEEDEESNSVG